MQNCRALTEECTKYAVECSFSVFTLFGYAFCQHMCKLCEMHNQPFFAVPHMLTFLGGWPELAHILELIRVLYSEAVFPLEQCTP